MSDEAHNEAGKLLDPILSVFSGEDGGVAFSNLRHSFLPNMLEQRGKNPDVDAFLKMVEQFSRLCTLMKKD